MIRGERYPHVGIRRDIFGAGLPPLCARVPHGLVNQAGLIQKLEPFVREHGVHVGGAGGAERDIDALLPFPALEIFFRLVDPDLQ